MHPLSIVMAFGFLASLVVVGAVLVWLGTRRLPGQVRGGTSTGSVTLSLFWHSLLVMLGLVLAVYGALGTFRVIWGT